jgi:hypothetical protein
MPAGRTRLTSRELERRRILGVRMERALRTPPGITLEMTARRIGISGGVLSRCLRGERGLSPARMALFLDVTGFALDDLMNPDEDAPLTRSADPRYGECPAFLILLEDPRLTVFLRCDEGQHGPGMHRDARMGGDAGVWWMDNAEHDLAVWSALMTMAEVAPRGMARR